jgi:type II secretory pathway component PulF
MLAENEDQLALTLRQMDLYLVAAKLERSTAPIYVTRPVKRTELINFTVHLSSAIGAGIPILQAFEDLVHQTTNLRMKKALQMIMDDLHGGSSLSAALSRHPHIFSDVFTAMVRAGETGGTLVNVLQGLISFLEWQETLASEIKRATIYPATVFIAVLLLVSVLLGFVFPRILPVIQGLKVPLPFITRAVMAVAEFVRNGWYLILLGGVGCVVAVPCNRHAVGKNLPLPLRPPLGHAPSNRGGYHPEPHDHRAGCGECSYWPGRNRGKGKGDPRRTSLAFSSGDRGFPSFGHADDLYRRDHRNHRHHLGTGYGVL